MTLRWYQRTDAGDLEEMVERVAVMHDPDGPGTDGLVTNAEEGSVGRSQIRVDDPDGTFSIRGHRRVEAIEDEATDDDWDGVVWFGFSYTQTIEEGTPFDGIGRIWTIDLDDLNTAFERRIMDSGANRPAETDVARVLWVLTTSQANLIDDDSMVSTDDPVNMDACDYRGQKLRDILDDCAQQSQKNWYLLKLGIDLGGGGDVLFSPWYGHGTLDTFHSGVTITNSQADVDADETGMTFLPSSGTKLHRDPSRVFSKVWMEYDGGHVIEDRPATAVAFAIGGRDTNSQAMNVKSATKARARAQKYLGSISTEEHVIETAIVVPAALVNAVVHGHGVDVKFSWMPDYSVLATGRVLNRTPRQIGEGFYELALEIAVEPPPVVVAAGPAQVYFAGDNGVEVWVNGTFIGDNSADHKTSPLDVADGILVSGENVVAIRVTNGVEPASWVLGNETFLEARLLPTMGGLYVSTAATVKTWDVSNTPSGALGGTPVDWNELAFDDSGWDEAIDVTGTTVNIIAAAPIAPARVVAPPGAPTGTYARGLVWLARMTFTAS